MSRTRLRRMAVLLAASGLTLAACSSGGTSSTSGSAQIPTTGSIRGQHITVLLPDYVPVPQSLLNQFTQQTGATVTLDSSSFDNIRSKIEIAGAAGTSVADVTEFDWSWTGQFGGAGYYVPLQHSLPKSTLSDLSYNDAFTYKGNLYAACYSNSFDISAYNTKQWAAAGISQPPSTFAQLGSDLNQIKARKAAAYPLTLTLSSTESASTEWYLLTLAMGGQLFDAGYHPLFASPSSAGYKALSFEVGALHQGLAPPGAVAQSGMDSHRLFAGGEAATILDGGPDEVGVANQAPQSRIKGQAAFFLVPGADGPGPTYALPEGLGIPKSSTHKQAALAFINWWLEPKTQLELGNQAALFSCRKSVIPQQLAAGDVVGAAQVSEEISHIRPLFPQGVPAWYTAFSTDAASQINSAAKGDKTVAQALSALASQANHLVSQSHG